MKNRYRKNRLNVDNDLSDISDEDIKNFDRDKKLDSRLKEMKEIDKKEKSVFSPRLESDGKGTITVISSDKDKASEIRDIPFFSRTKEQNQELVDYFQSKNRGIKATDIDKLFENKDELDKLRVENKRLDTEKYETEFLFRKQEEKIRELEEKLVLKNEQLSDLTNSLTEQTKVEVEKVIRDYNEKLAVVDGKIAIYEIEVKELNEKLNIKTNELFRRDNENATLNQQLLEFKSSLSSLEVSATTVSNEGYDLSTFKSNLLRLKQVEAITEELLKTVSKYPKVYEEYKKTIKGVASIIRNIKV